MWRSWTPRELGAPANTSECPGGLSAHPSGPQMAPSVCLVLLLAVLLSLAVTPASAPVHQGRGGWTLNSAGYLLGPELHLLQSRHRGSGKKTALEVPERVGHSSPPPPLPARGWLWKLADGLPNPHPQQATKRSPRETLAKPEMADPGELSKKAPREGEVLQS